MCWNNFFKKVHRYNWVNNPLLPFDPIIKLIVPLLNPYIHVISLNKTTVNYIMINFLGYSSWSLLKNDNLPFILTLPWTCFLWKGDPTYWESLYTLISRSLPIHFHTVLRAASCVKMTSTDHLHEETKVIPFNDHLSLICSQCLVKTLQPNNLSQNVVTSFGF